MNRAPDRCRHRMPIRSFPRHTGQVLERRGIVMIDFCGSGGPIEHIRFKVSIRMEIIEDEDGYYGTAPALPGLLIDGDTIDEVKRHMKDGIVAHLLSIISSGYPIPVGRDLQFELTELRLKKEDEPLKFGEPEPTLNRANQWETVSWPTQEPLGVS